jgi:S-adenosylmethionine:tRNA ribosyltransferase-isomerase
METPAKHNLRADAFDFDLPEELIAQRPIDRRDQSRLMGVCRPEGELAHHVFADLPDLLRPTDVLVLNDTRVIPARFNCRRSTGRKIEGLFIQEDAPGLWDVMLKNAGRCNVDDTLSVPGHDDVEVTLLEDCGQGRWRVGVRPAEPAVLVLDRIGQTPLPPYIRRADDSQDAVDRSRYQTVYADRPGAVAAPTAGLHFTDTVFDALDVHGVERVTLTLHVGLGTFLPVKTDRLDDHQMHSEWYELSAEAAERLNAARRDGRRIVAVGTTSVRVLETVARDAPTGGEPFGAASGWTDIFIYPPADFRAVDALITNFHLPRSTLVMLVAAFCSPGGTDGTRMILDAYAQAVQREYRFYSYGDAMLIE